uniref:Target of rapamycin complex subunit lst8 n=1 Tax=Meloidogyne javanica TaxID=6303 RepID=A0A915MAA0_MELJA
MGYGLKPLLISASMDSTIRLWDVATQMQLEALHYKESQVNTMCITPDGAQFLIGGWQNLRIYDLNCLTNSGLHNSAVHEKNITSVGFQSDGVWLYTGGEDCMAKIWDMRINQLNCQLHSIALHPNQIELLISDATGAVYIWDLRSDRDDTLSTEVDVSEYIVHIDIDRLGRQCAAVTNRGNLFFWEINHKGGGLAKTIPHLDTTADNGSTQKLQRQTTPQELKEDESTTEFYSSSMIDTGLPPIAPPPLSEMGGDGSAFYVPAPRRKQRYGAKEVPQSELGEENEELKQIEQEMLKNPSMTVTPPHRSSLPVDLISNAKYRMKLRAHKSFALKCRYRPDSLAIATCSADQTTKLWSVSDHNLLSTYAAPNSKWVWDCAFTNDSAYMLTASSDGIIRMWELASSSVVQMYQGHSLGITCMAFKDFS